MSVNHNTLNEARKAKRLANFTRGVNASIQLPTGDIVPMKSVSIACENHARELLADFVSELDAEEVIQQAYRIVNFQRRRDR